MSSESATVRVKLVRSPNSTPARHRLCVKALGLKRMHQIVELKDSPSVRGLIEKVNYLVRVEG
ncbi:MAG: 50S ribosomal protein L30 [Xanthomonadales bacterium]|nr:50S ribosomal protein L30 [Xanthomonadales bacterium]MCC6591938.1 50S ribosomal protein L30 [Xanthomonadales bacterium]MCE7930443.1 50S ribosomal protein L30 [Xanthomonadales bacterium PRO6]